MQYIYFVNTYFKADSSEYFLSSICSQLRIIVTIKKAIVYYKDVTTKVYMYYVYSTFRVVQ